VQPPVFELVNAVDVDAVHGRPVVAEHGRQRPSHDFATVDHGNDLPLQVLADGFRLVVAARAVLEDFHHGQRRTRQQAFLRVGRVIEEPDVPVQVRPVRVTQSLHVASVADGISQEVVVTFSAERLDLSEDGVVHDDAVDARIFVGVQQGRLDVERVVDLAQLVPQSVVPARLAGPLGVLSRGGVVVREQPDQQRRFCDFLMIILLRGGGRITTTIKMRVSQPLPAERERLSFILSLLRLFAYSRNLYMHAYTRTHTRTHARAQSRRYVPTPCRSSCWTDA